MSKEKWTEQNIPDLTGKTIVVTGGSSGLGFESAKMFAKKNALVVIASRSIERCEEAKNTILSEVPQAQVDVLSIDLGNLESIANFVKEYKTKYKKLDVLLNNAGVMMTPFQKTSDGFEFQNGINHLGHFALTAQLFDLIAATPNSRIVNVASIAHRFGKIDFSNYMYENGKYSATRSYGRSKLSNLLFTYELDKRVRNAGKEVLVIAAHPGISSTNLGRYLKQGRRDKFVQPITNLISQDAYTGALPQVRACVDETAQGGEYYGPRGFMQARGLPKVVGSNKRSKNVQLQKNLWDVSENLTKVAFEV